MKFKFLSIFLFILTASFCSLFSHAQAEQSDEEKFSKYSGEFTVATIYGTPRVTRFAGEVLVRGEMVFRFDQISATELGELMFADFIPDEEFRSMFPQVEQGFYAMPLSSVSISNSEEALSQVFDEVELQELKDSASSTLSKRGTVKVNEYSVFVECDSRQYTAYLVSFEQESEIASKEIKEGLSGC